MLCFHLRLDVHMSWLNLGTAHNSILPRIWTKTSHFLPRFFVPADQSYATKSCTEVFVVRHWGTFAWILDPHHLNNFRLLVFRFLGPGPFPSKLFTSTWIKSGPWVKHVPWVASTLSTETTNRVFKIIDLDQQSPILFTCRFKISNGEHDWCKIVKNFKV